MNSAALSALLVIYLSTVFGIGFLIYRKWFIFATDTLATVASSALIGVLVTIPVTYIVSCIFSKTAEPMLWGVAATTLLFGLCIGFGLRIGKRKMFEKVQWTWNEAALSVVALSVSVWLMQKSFHIDAGGTWLVASNTVFDMAHELSIIRSFSFGNNIPFTSPFAAGYQEIYHFFFYFFVAILEKFSVPLSIAFNGVSALGFWLYLVMGYYFAFFLFGKKRLVGWLTVVFLLGNSSLTWIYFLLSHALRPDIIPTIWHLAAYPYAGPYDGSVISLFFTLNVFVNQRHLAIGLAFGIWLFIAMVSVLEKKKIDKLGLSVLGGLIGLTVLWNIVLSFTFVMCVLLLCIIRKKTPYCLYIGLGFVITAFFSMGSYLQNVVQMFLSQMTQSTGESIPSAAGLTLIEQLKYWWMNIGIAWGIGIYGFCRMGKKERTTILPILLLFIILVLGLASGKNIMYQKMLNFWNIGFVAIVAYGVSSIWEKKRIRVWAVLLIGILTISGGIDLMVIKNDFAYPAVSSEVDRKIMKLREILPNTSIVLSYKEMFQDIALAGRKQYYGYFADTAADVRARSAREIFESTTAAELDENIQKIPITHIYLSKKALNDFPYETHLDFYRALYPVRYEDSASILFEVTSHMVQ